MCSNRWLCVVLALCLILSVLPTNVVAAEQTVAFEMLGYVRDSLTEQDSDVVVGDGPALAEGNHARWIDRVANLPDYAWDFYNWLIDNATENGALMDPTLGETRNSSYVHTLVTITGTADFTYTSSSDRASAAKEAALADIGDQPQIVMSYARAVFGAFDMDHPEVFWLSGSSMCGYGMGYSYSYGGGSGTVSYEVPVYFYLQSSDFDLREECYQSMETIADGISQRDNDVTRLLADCPNTSAYDQILYLNRILTRTNCYNTAVYEGNRDLASPMAWQSVSALSGSVGTDGPVCEGYSRAFKVLCDELGIPCVLVEGYSKSSASASAGSHMWNYVQLDGSWYAVDVTWNDPVVSGVESAVSGYEREKWLLLGSDTIVNTNLTFLESHEVENKATSNGLCYTNGPELASDVYTLPENLMEVSQYRSGDTYTAPEMEGSVFAGWYTDAAMTQPLSANDTEGHAYAKFVDEKVLTARWQITAGTTADSESTDLRILTSVDSLGYDSVGFVVAIGTAEHTLTTNRVYSQIRAGDKLISSASAVFGEQSRYFMTYMLTDVPQGMYDADITVTPCWITLDGTMVTGVTRTFRVSQAF